ncbi:hypothetical protein EVAR_10706_1 [Eumeta japonica]|uniref:Sodium/calcium exchanger membrane region domain-containing protein n=1 Tax=Eumeta variegata TaxID=151549 RepID=A0A4C1U8J2_EUMVA|nr:hypothetical protein EVAR_10706_1 [Eumeta japonica]
MWRWFGHLGRMNDSGLTKPICGADVCRPDGKGATQTVRRDALGRRDIVTGASHVDVSKSSEPQGSDDPDEPPSCSDYVLHFLTLFWKIIFALIPPTDIGGGYVCFIVSIVCIGLVTAVIGDVASHFGCTLGIKDSVTAIVFVALGTSIPEIRSGEADSRVSGGLHVNRVRSESP